MIITGFSEIIYSYKGRIIFDVLGVFSSIFGLVYIHYSIYLKSHTRFRSSSGVASFLRLGYVLTLVNLFCRALVSNSNVYGVLFPTLISTLVFIYLYHNVKRLSGGKHIA